MPSKTTLRSQVEHVNLRIAQSTRCANLGLNGTAALYSHSIVNLRHNRLNRRDIFRPEMRNTAHKPVKNLA